GNFYITFLLAGLMELPAQLFTPIFLRYIGRRKLYAMFMIITALSCVAVIPAQSSWLRVLFALVSKYGISTSWNVLTIHGSEIYPTVIRNTGMGVASVVARIGSISAPFMGNLYPPLIGTAIVKPFVSPYLKNIFCREVLPVLCVFKNTTLVCDSHEL
ncbi:unnamed protein product, partial [Medioppia subpectinata]